MYASFISQLLQQRNYVFLIENKIYCNLFYSRFYIFLLCGIRNTKHKRLERTIVI